MLLLQFAILAHVMPYHLFSDSKFIRLSLSFIHPSFHIRHFLRMLMMRSESDAQLWIIQ
jgi:hypothetical protein